MNTTRWCNRRRRNNVSVHQGVTTITMSRRILNGRCSTSKNFWQDRRCCELKSAVWHCAFWVWWWLRKKRNTTIPYLNANDYIHSRLHSAKYWYKYHTLLSFARLLKHCSEHRGTCWNPEGCIFQEESSKLSINKRYKKPLQRTKYQSIALSAID